MTAPKVGDRVRVVLEGEVVARKPSGFFVAANDGRSNYIYPEAPHVVSVEVLPPPEPEWKPGDVVQTPGGYVYVRTNGGAWAAVGSSVTRRHADLQRPLARLVPEGQS